MKKTTKILSIIASLVMSGSAITFCHAEDTPDIKVYFTPKSASQNLVGDNIAQVDDVQCTISNAADINFSNKDVEVPEGTIFTITSNTFKNIMGVRLFFETVSANDNIVQIISAEGSGFTNISELNGEKKNQTTTNTVRFYFSNPLVLLSEIQLKMLQDDVLIKIEVSLDVEPDFLVKDGETIYGDDSIPFVKRSNYVPYLYGVDVTDSEEPDEFFTVPDDGIKLTGQTKGQHIVYVNVDDNKTDGKRAIKTVMVNYDPVKPDEGSTTSIDSINSESESVYYDLTGRRISPKPGQLLIRKNGSNSKLIRL